MALKTWVTVRTPRSNAACASAAVALRVAERDDDAPAPCRRSTRSSAPGSSGASVIEPDGPGREEALEQRRVGIAPRGEPVRAEPARGEERPLQVHAEDARAGGVARDEASAATRSPPRERDEASAGRP